MSIIGNAVASGISAAVATVLALTPTPTRAEQPPEEAKVAMREAVRGAMIDPGSTRFRWHDLPADFNGPIYCGYINSRNRFGGYTGYQLFTVILFGPEGGWRSSLYQLTSEDSEYRIAVMLCNQYGFTLKGPFVDDPY